jgi:hypothetical protein
MYMESKRVPNLRELWRLVRRVCVSDGGVNDSDVMAIAELCPQLEHLDIETSDVTEDAIADVAARCPRLRTLNLPTEGEHIVGELLYVIGEHCPQLRSFSASLPEADSEALCALAQGCPLLEVLDIP